MIKFIKKMMLFLPIPVFMIAVSYRIDPSGLFWGAGFERQACEYMLQGEYIDGYERMNGRTLNETYAKNVEQAPRVLINGSSKSMTIDSSFAQGKTLYNAANVGGDVYDFYTSYYIFAKEGKEPQIIVFGLDPWLFNDDPSALDSNRNNKELYYEFLGEELGYTGLEYQKDGKLDKYLALLDPSYFQGSVSYFFKDKSGDVSPQIVPKEDIYNRKEVIKCPDGSIIYDVDFRTRSPEEADFDALTMANTNISRIYDFTAMSESYKEHFEKFIEYLQAKGIKIIFYLPPYHPAVYNTIISQYDTYKGVPETEIYLKATAEKYSIPLYGSYSPYSLQLDYRDFLDGQHLRAESVHKILPNIE